MKSILKKEVLFYITYIAIIIFALVNFEKIFNFIGCVLGILSPFLFGILIAFILNVLVNYIETKLFSKVKKGGFLYKAKRIFSITLSLILVVLIIYIVMNLLIPQLKNSITVLTDSLPSYKADIVDVLYKFDASDNTIDKVSSYLDDLGKVITDYIKGNSKDVITLTTEVASSIVTVVSTFVIALVFAIYMIAQKETLKRQVNKVMEAYLKPSTIKRITDISVQANKTFSSFVTGQCLEALIFGTLCFIGMIIFKFPYALMISVIMAITALIPVLGAFIGLVLGTFLILMISPIKAILFVVFILILQQFEGNIIYPRVVGKSVGLPGMWVLFSVTIGASIGGVIGMLIATPLFSLVYSLFTQEVNDRIKRNKIVSKVKS